MKWSLRSEGYKKTMIMFFTNFFHLFTEIVFALEQY